MIINQILDNIQSGTNYFGLGTNEFRFGHQSMGTNYLRFGHQKISILAPSHWAPITSLWSNSWDTFLF
jgi:hypothetical protein